MVSEIPGSDSSDSGKPYKAQYPLNEQSFPVWKKFWGSLFHNRQDLTHDDVAKRTDTFINFISKEMGKVLDHALKVQKANDKAMESGEAPDLT